MNKLIFTLYQYMNQANGKCYIGITNNPSMRAKAHANGGSHARVFNRAVKKYGIDAFGYKVLAVFDDLLAAAYHEQAAIIKLGTLAPNGYNLRAGAPFTIYNGAINAETCAKISTSLKGHKRSVESIAKTIAAKKGKPLSQEHRTKISIARKGKPSGREGQTFSNEQRARISAACIGREFTNETRTRMSESQKARWAKRKSEALRG